MSTWQSLSERCGIGHISRLGLYIMAVLGLTAEARWCNGLGILMSKFFARGGSCMSAILYF
jgi:hypothetical protein